MPGLTVTEKEHWKDRISRRIDKRIEVVSAAEPTGFELGKCFSVIDLWQIDVSPYQIRLAV